jgi:uncharacterized membrane protein YfcA
MELLLISAITLVASFVGSVTGFGVSLLMMPVLLLIAPLPQALLFAGIVHWFDDVWKMLLFHRGVRWRIVLVFGVTGAVSAYVGAKLSFVLPEGVLIRGLGAFLLLYVAFVGLRPRWKLPRSDSSDAVGGGLSGFLAGVIGLGGALRSAVLIAYDLPKAAYLFTVGAVAFLTDTARLWAYVAGGTALTGPLRSAVIICVMLSLLASWSGKKLVDRIPQVLFRKVVASGLFVLGIKLLLF